MHSRYVSLSKKKTRISDGQKTIRCCEGSIATMNTNACI